MSLVTQRYSGEQSFEQEVEQPFESGWPEVAKALNGMVFGYILVLVNVALATGLIIFLLMHLAPGGKKSMTLGEVTTVLFAGAGVIFLLGLWTLYLLVRNKWRCLTNAPERYGAKWWMFASILCLLTGPALNFISPFLGDGPRAKKSSKSFDSTKMVADEIETYKKLGREMSVANSMRMAGSVASGLSTVFFVMFLRAVALCFNSWLARLAEAHLALSVLVSLAFSALIFQPQGIPLIQILMAILIGSLLSFVSYFVLLIGTSICINLHTPKGYD